MKILLLGSNCNFNLEYFTKENLARLGCQVKFCGYSASLGFLASPTRLSITRSNWLAYAAYHTMLRDYNLQVLKLADEFRPDVVLAIKGEALNPAMLRKLKHEGTPRMALWYTDDPRYRGTIIRRIVHYFDCVFTVSPMAVDAYKEMGIKAKFLPVACDPIFHRKIELTEEERRRYSCDLVFVGTYYPSRAKVLNLLRNARIGVKVYGDYWNYLWAMKGAKSAIPGPEMVKAFNGAKIVLNVHAGSDLDDKVNTRTYEATGCRSFLLTDRSKRMDEAFEIGKELQCYDSAKDLLEMTKFYLGSEKERMEISIKGQERAYRDHTYEIRLRQLISMLS